MEKRGLALSVFLILAVAMFASTIPKDNSNELSGMQIKTHTTSDPMCTGYGTAPVCKDLPVGSSCNADGKLGKCASGGIQGTGYNCDCLPLPQI